MKKKPTLPSQKKKPKANISKKIKPYTEQYRDFFTFQMRPVSIDFIKKLCSDLLQWAVNDKDALIVRDFFMEKGIPWKTVESWIDKYDFLADSVREATLFIGSRREKGAIKRQYDAGMIKHVQHQYDNIWKQTEEWKASLRQIKEEKINTANIQWILHKFPSSDLVPEKPSIKGEDEKD